LLTVNPPNANFHNTKEHKGKPVESSQVAHMRQPLSRPHCIGFRYAHKTPKGETQWGHEIEESSVNTGTISQKRQTGKKKTAEEAIAVLFVNCE